MSKGDGNLKRLGAIVTIFCFLLFLYSCKAILMNDASDYESLTGDIEEQTTDKDKSLSPWDAIATIGDFLGFFFGLMFFQIGTLSWYFNIFLIPLYSILLVGFWGLILDYIFDIADLIPFIG